MIATCSCTIFREGRGGCNLLLTNPGEGSCTVDPPWLRPCYARYVCSHCSSSRR